jgi:chemotaxis protein histidine kinase CheA
MVDVLVLAIGGGLYAVPADVVAETIPVAVADLERADGRIYAVVDGHRVCLHSLGRALDEPEPAEEGEILVLRCPEAAAAFLIDAARDRREIAVRPVNRAGNSRSLIAGRADAEGREIRLLDVGALLHLGSETTRGAAASAREEA